MRQYDIGVIGGGPAGYIAAIKGAQLGAKIILFEKDILGGTCLNRGCIPTKTYLKGADIIQQIQQANRYGILNDKTIEINMKKAVNNKNEIVNRLTHGVGALLKANDVDVVYGEALLNSENVVECNEQFYNVKSVILCGGSEAHRISIPGIDDENVLTSDEILNLEEIPRRLIIIGGGVIGCEIATIFSWYGSEVVIIEAETRILPQMDNEIAKALEVVLQKRKVRIITSCTVKQVCRTGVDSIVICENGEKIQGDKVLLSIGRTADLKCLGKMKDKITQERGKVSVNECLETNIAGIFAAGDINGKCMLAHAASKMGEVAARNALGEKLSCDLRYVPNCVYTLPECAGVGMTESQAAEKYGKDNILIGKFPFSANGRALTANATEGFIKIVIDRTYKEILGVHIFGEIASELINEAAALMAAEIPADEVAEYIHAHPTFSEAFMEACADAVKCCMNLPPRS